MTTKPEQLDHHDRQQELAARVHAHHTLAIRAAQTVNTAVRLVPRGNTVPELTRAAGRLSRESERMTGAHAALVTHAQEAGLDCPPAPADPREGLRTPEARAAVDAAEAGEDVANAVAAARERQEAEKAERREATRQAARDRALATAEAEQQRRSSQITTRDDTPRWRRKKAPQ